MDINLGFTLVCLNPSRHPFVPLPSLEYIYQPFPRSNKVYINTLRQLWSYVMAWSIVLEDKKRSGLFFILGGRPNPTQPER
jgi:hypothetical protein